MNALSGRANYGTTTGRILINGEENSVNNLGRLVGFVPQEDIMLRELTGTYSYLYLYIYIFISLLTIVSIFCFTNVFFSFSFLDICLHKPSYVYHSHSSH